MCRQWLGPRPRVAVALLLLGQNLAWMTVPESPTRPAVKVHSWIELSRYTLSDISKSIPIGIGASRMLPSKYLCQDSGIVVFCHHGSGGGWLFLLLLLFSMRPISGPRSCLGSVVGRRTENRECEGGTDGPVEVVVIFQFFLSLSL